MNPGNALPVYNEPKKAGACCGMRSWKLILASLVTAIIAIVLVAVVLLKTPSSPSSPKNQATGSIVSTESVCPTKTIQITHICNLPDLDDDFLGRDTTMDIKVLVQDELYWPRNTSLDCLETYGSYDGSCVIPDTSLMGCFALSNSVQIEFNETFAPPEQLKITIYDDATKTFSPMTLLTLWCLSPNGTWTNALL